ncbi:hypothetical protein F511_45900 [Dorcoceras hygrometricum]|uniref:Uncharacterized protein n=1 Tax=Dorcoceras hygrometricum TaxID=472368 RepID=A0A2Z6ZUX1_9LAMI|nr:hypothetical protein F511_45900 [Dorcoceras hygrometricum]
MTAAGAAPCGGAIARSSARAWPPAGQHALSRAGRPPCANVAHGGALLCVCLARPGRACCVQRAAVCRTLCDGGGRRSIFPTACCDLFCLLNLVGPVPGSP